MIYNEEVSRQEMFSGTKEVAGSLQFDVQKLEDYMKSHVEGFKGPLTVMQFKGGQSNPTYQLITPGRKYVMRRRPPGNLLPSAHAGRASTISTFISPSTSSAPQPSGMASRGGSRRAAPPTPMPPRSGESVAPLAEHAWEYAQRAGAK